jgi:hypothetical protein
VLGTQILLLVVVIIAIANICERPLAGIRGLTRDYSPAMDGASEQPTQGRWGTGEALRESRDGARPRLTLTPGLGDRDGHFLLRESVLRWGWGWPILGSAVHPRGESMGEGACSGVGLETQRSEVRTFGPCCHSRDWTARRAMGRQEEPSGRAGAQTSMLEGPITRAQVGAGGMEDRWSG